MRPIDADAMIEDLLTVNPQYQNMIDFCVRITKAQPTINIRLKGKWAKTGQSFVFPDKFRNYCCSECQFEIDKIKYRFCPNCGADMRESEGKE